MASKEIELAAKALAECMDYPWEHMPEKGREAMRQHAAKVAAPLLAAERERCAKLEAWLRNAQQPANDGGATKKEPS